MVEKQIFKCKSFMEAQRAAKKILLEDRSTWVACKVIAKEDGFDLEVTYGGEE